MSKKLSYLLVALVITFSLLSISNLVFNVVAGEQEPDPIAKQVQFAAEQEPDPIAMQSYLV
ncbi:hypothetical protein ACFSCX_18020 [Bacillus salitolerans]|uniref:Uncharacterized protein n=1 Tax=Bacillus salitolerans TaxID=1437434 RepID=A0ABW4LTM5_9BACI